MHRILTALLACLVALGLLLTPQAGFTPRAQAQPPDSQLGESLGFVILFPELRTLPAPTWFVPGVRVSYNSRSASFQNGGTGGAAGVGITQYDVVGNRAGWAIVSAQNFGNNGANQLIPFGPAPKVGLPAVGEIWIHPLVLQNAEAVAHQTLSVTRINKNVLGQTRQIVRFQDEFLTQSGVSRTVWEFNAADGLLTFYSKSLGDSTATQLELLDFRTVNNLATQGNTAPNWVRPEAILDFTGTQTQQIPGAGAIPASFAIRNTIVAATPGWSIQTQATFLSNTPMGSAATATGGGQIFGALWLPTAALNRVPNQPQILFNDPATGASIDWGRANNGEIFVRESNQAYQTILYYDPALGALNGVQQQIASATSVMQLDLRRTGGSNLNQLNSLPPLQSDPTPDPTPIESDLDQPQQIDVDLPANALRLNLPANFVSEPVNVAVGFVPAPPPPPAGLVLRGDAFALTVTTRDGGEAVPEFLVPIDIRVALGESTIAANTSAHHATTGAASTPSLYHRTAAGWQLLESTYNADTRMVTASHNRAGVYAVFAPEPDQNPSTPADGRIFLPTLRR